MKKLRANVALTLVWLVLGLLLATSFFTQRRVESETTGPRTKQLIAVIKEIEQEKKGVEEKLEELRETVRIHEEKAAADQGVLASFKKELDKLKSVGGFTKAKGKGIKVTLADSSRVPIGEDPNNYIIHDYDLRAVVNALWAGGAEAIAINNQRLVSTSAVRCVGNTILINSNRLASPYKVKAIGNYKKLEDALEKDKQVKRLTTEYSRLFGLIVDVEETSNIQLPAYEGSLGVEHAQIVEEKKS